MSVIRGIPEQHHQGFVVLNELDDETFESELSTLDKAPMSLGIKRLSLAIGTNDQIEEMLFAVGNLSLVGDRQGGTIEELADDVEGLIESGHIKGLKTKKPVFRDRLIRLLKSEALYYSSKAINVLQDHEHVFVSGRVIVDWRPIFSRSIDQHPNAGVIVHMMGIHYHDVDQHKEIFMALDDEDLQSLKIAIERAQHKAKAMRSVLSKAGVNLISSEERNQ